jgi:hypothetical protein
MNTNNEEQEVICNSAYNPFPEPQTIPSGWDISGLTLALQIESDVPAEDSSETEAN